jgi:uncharacterized membrane protein
MPDHASAPRTPAFGIWLILAGVVGWTAAFELTLERLHLLANPAAAASCDFSVLVQCKANLESWQGSAFGFPNPILGLAGWVAPVIMGVAVLARVRFPGWFWGVFWFGTASAFGLVTWFISQSIFQLHTLCPWCMLTWSMTIPTFYAVTVHVLRIGAIPVTERTQVRAGRLMVWVPLATILSYAVVILLAQLRLDAIPNVFATFFG